jgi:hypothetical protein
MKVAARVAVNLESIASHGCLTELSNVRQAYSTVVTTITTPRVTNMTSSCDPPSSLSVMIVSMLPMSLREVEFRNNNPMIADTAIELCHVSRISSP